MKRRCWTRAPDGWLGLGALMVLRLYHDLAQASQNHGNDRRQGLRPTAAFHKFVQALLERLGLLDAGLGGQVLDDRFEVLPQLGGRRAMAAVELQELAEEVVPWLAARVREQLPAGDQGVGQAAEDLGDLDAQPARVFAGTAPEFGTGVEVVVAVYQVVGGLHEDGAEAAIAAAAQGAAVQIDLVALVARGHKAGATGDGVGVGVQLDGPELAGEVGDGDDVDAGDDEQQGVGGADDEVGQSAFQLEDLPGFGEAIVVEGAEDALQVGHVAVARRRLLGPGEHLVQGVAADDDRGRGGAAVQAFQSGLAHGLGGGEVPGQDQWAGRLPRVAEALGVAGHGGVQGLADLTAQQGGLVDEVAAVAVEGDIVVRPGGFDQAEAVGAGAEDGGEVGVIGLVVGVGRLAILLGGVGVDEAGVEAGLAEGALDGPMVFTGAFDEDDGVAEVVLLLGVADAFDGGLQVAAGVGQGGGFQERAAVEVAEQVAGGCVGTIDGEDAEVLGPDGPDPGAQLAGGLLQVTGLAVLGRPRGNGT